MPINILHKEEHSASCLDHTHVITDKDEIKVQWLQKQQKFMGQLPAGK